MTDPDPRAYNEAGGGEQPDLRLVKLLRAVRAPTPPKHRIRQRRSTTCSGDARPIPHSAIPGLGAGREGGLRGRGHSCDAGALASPIGNSSDVVFPESQTSKKNAPHTRVVWGLGVKHTRLARSVI
jgi:hypothetical protein